MRRTGENLEIPFLGLLFLTLGQGVAIVAVALGAPRTFVAELFVSVCEAWPRARTTAAALRGRLLAVATPSAVPDGAGWDGWA